MVGNKKQGNVTTNIIDPFVGGNLTVINKNVSKIESSTKLLIDWEILIECVKAKYLQGNKFKTILRKAEEIASCYINLAIVEEKEQKNKEQVLKNEKLKRQERLNSYEEIYETKISILPQNIFAGQNDKALKRQLILGRAGIGKSVLCQYLAYQWAKEGWWKQEAFKLLVWIPLRQLANKNIYPKKSEAVITLGKVLYEQFKEQLHAKLPASEVARWIKSLDNLIKEHSAEILYVLDGFDEVANICQLDDSQTTRQTEIICFLLNQSQVMITSRPYYIDNYLTSQGIRIDRRLENIGFVDKDIQAYIQRYPWKITKQQETLKSLLNSNSLMRGIAHIPINLALLCRYWNSHQGIQELNLGLTSLYEGLVGDLLYEHLGKQSGKGYISFEDESGDEILENEAIQPVLMFLEKLAFLQMQEDTLLISQGRVTGLLKELRVAKKIEKFKKVLVAGLLVSPDEEERCFEEKREYYFIHLTFQEFLAARYIARLFKQNNEQFREVALLERERLSQRISSQSLDIFVQNYKYDLRYEIVWWFVAGLLKEHKPGIERFFNRLLSDPRDLSSFYDVLQWIKCLEESKLTCNLNEELKKNLIEEIRNIAQASFDSGAYISREQYSKVFFEYLYSSPMLYGELGILQTKEAVRKALGILKWHSNLPANVLNHMVSLLRDKEENAKSLVLDALKNQPNLQSEMLDTISILLKDKDVIVRGSALDVLGNQQNLATDILSDMENLLHDSNELVKSSTLFALSRQVNLPSSVLVSIASLGNNKKEGIRKSEQDVLDGQMNLPEDVLDVLSRLLNNQKMYVKNAALLALGHQQNLHPSVLSNMANLLHDPNGFVRSSALEALGYQSNLPSSVLNAMVVLLNDKNKDVRSSAQKALGRQVNLPSDVLREIVTLLRDEGSNMRNAVPEASGTQPNLVPIILGEIINSLRNDEQNIRNSLQKTLGEQSSSLLNPLMNIASWLGDKEMNLKSSEQDISNSQQNLPTNILGTILNYVNEREEWDVKGSALKALNGQTNLPPDVLSILVSLLGNKKEEIKNLALKALSRQMNLPSDILSILVGLLDDKKKEIKNTVLKALGRQTNLLLSVLSKVVVLIADKIQAYGFNNEEVNFINRHLIPILDNPILRLKLSSNPALLSAVILKNNFLRKNVVYFKNNQALIIKLGQQFKEIAINDKEKFLQEFNKQRMIWLNKKDTTTSLTKLTEQSSVSTLLTNPEKQERFDLIKEKNIRGDEEFLFSFLAFAPFYHPSKGVSIINEPQVEDEEIETITNKFICLTS